MYASGVDNKLVQFKLITHKVKHQNSKATVLQKLQYT